MTYSVSRSSLDPKGITVQFPTGARILVFLSATTGYCWFITYRNSLTCENTRYISVYEVVKHIREYLRSI